MIDSNTFLDMLDSLMAHYQPPTILVSRETHRRLLRHMTHGYGRYRRSVALRRQKRRQCRAAFRRKKRGLA